MCVYSQLKDNCFTLCQACLVENLTEIAFMCLSELKHSLSPACISLKSFEPYQGKLSLVQGKRVGLGNAVQIPIVFCFLFTDQLRNEFL